MKIHTDKPWTHPEQSPDQGPDQSPDQGLALLQYQVVAALAGQWVDEQAGGLLMSEVKQEYVSCLLSGCVVFHAGEKSGEWTLRG